MVAPVVSYTREPTAKGYPGMVATTEPHWITSMIGEVGTGDIPFGSAVVYGATDDTVKKPTAGGKFAGIAVADRTVLFAQGLVFRQYDQFGCMRNGTIFVTALANVVQGDPVYMTPTGGLTNASSGNTILADAEWMDTAAANAPARIRLNVTK
ncbi:hypothetical protein D3218_13050 [Aureimonas flava]|uniref:DUF2190 family protein n=1 Tax=Aureimonas flava TaxID=2320271 RepID=A0A3A1WLG3_9HYPH|nr:hypothetical protein [Aureimonas flava]RIY00207.1 hypothetical protein D3218_13050 [Aureimonas flava]